MSCILLHVFADVCTECKNIPGMNNIKSVGHMRVDNIMQQNDVSEVNGHSFLIMVRNFRSVGQ